MGDPYRDQRLFLRIVETGSIRAAALEAGLEPSSVSRRLTALEARLGTKLAERAQPRTRITEAGHSYYARMRDLLAQIDALEADLRGETAVPAGRLTVSAAIDFGQAHVARWLFAFRRAHPRVEVALSLSSRNVDMLASGVDVAIRVGPLADSALIARKLADVPRVLAAAPAYLAARGTPRCAADLAGHDHVFFLPEHRYRPLEITDPEGRVHSVPRQGGVTVNAVASVVAAVCAGHGLHAGPRWAFAEALATGRAVEVLPDHALPGMAMHAVRPRAVVVPARIRAFIEHAARAVEDVPGLVPVRRASGG